MALSSQNFKTKYKNGNNATIIVSSEPTWASKEAKFSIELDFCSLMRCFTAKIKQPLKNH